MIKDMDMQEGVVFTSLAVRAAHADLLVQIFRHELHRVALPGQPPLDVQRRAGGGLYQRIRAATLA